MITQDRACFICHATEPQEPTFQVVFPCFNGIYQYEIKWICRNHPWMGTFQEAMTGVFIQSYTTHSYYREGIANERTAST